MSVKPLLDAFRDYISLRNEQPVGDWFDRFDWNLSERNITPVTYKGMRHLEGIGAHVGRGEQRLVSCLIEYAPRLQWLQSYTADDFGQAFVDNYCHVELIGTRGHFVSDEIAGGLVLFGPGINYRDHWHVAEEIYFPMTSEGLWSRDGGDLVERKSGELIFHESNMRHAMKTLDKPLLAVWIWRGGDLAQKGNY